MPEDTIRNIPSRKAYMAAYHATHKDRRTSTQNSFQAKKWRRNNPEKLKNYNRQYRADHSEDRKRRDLEYKAAHPEQLRTWRRGYDLRRKYGLTHEKAESLLQSQDRRCAICRCPEPGGKGTWKVDHCHTTGKVRGLLCHHCNLILGMSKDSASLLRMAADYLDRHYSASSTDVSLLVGGGPPVNPLDTRNG